MHLGIYDTGELTFKHNRTCNFYIAYVRGEWYASNYYGFSSSKPIPQRGINMFCCAKNEYREYIPDKGAEIATHKLSLSKDVHNFVLFLAGTYFRLIIADGSKADCVLIMDTQANSTSCQTLVMALCAMIGQYNPTAATEIETFWYSNNEEDQYEKKKPVIDWSSQNSNPQTNNNTEYFPESWSKECTKEKNNEPSKENTVINWEKDYTPKQTKQVIFTDLTDKR